MKGQATITIKDRNGNIKYNGTHNNQITDIFKKSMQQYLNDLPWLESDCTPPTREAADFQGITLHSEDLTDELNMKPILLTGGTSAKGSRDWHYAAAINAVVEKSKISTSWSWAIEEPLSIKSLALCNEVFVGTADRIAPFYGFVSNKGFAWVTGSNKFGYIKKQTANLAKLRKTRKQSNIQASQSAGGVTYNNEYVVVYQSALYVLSMEDWLGGITTSEYESKALRSFNISQFNGEYYLNRYFKILSTVEKDYIITLYNNDYGNVAVYELPRLINTGTFEPVAVFLDAINGSVSFIKGTQTGDGCIMGFYDDKQFIITVKNDGTIDGRDVVLRATAYQGSTNTTPRQIATCPRTINQSYIANYSAYLDSAQKPIFAHTTILNLDAPITVETGDILNITYEITATE